MKTCKKCGNTKELTQFYADSHYRDGLKGTCKACCNAASMRWASDNRKRSRSNKAAWVAKNPERDAAHQKKYRRLNKSKLAESVANWQSRNPAKKEAGRRRWRERNRSTYLTTCAESGRKWRINNPGRVNARTARRRAMLIQASVAWADNAAIQALYESAARLTRETGTPFQVDHFVPLQSPFVCGLHNEFNLRVITAVENQRKHNSVAHLLQRQQRMFA